MDAQRLKQLWQQVVADHPEIALVYLFGSRVEGQIGPMSDWNFGVLIDRAVDDAPIYAQLTHKLARVLETDRVDVVRLNRAPPELSYAVIVQGLLLYERDVATRVEYEAYVLGRYGDFLPWLRAQRQEILHEGDHENRVRRYRAALRRTERALDQIRAAQGQDLG